MVEKLSDLVWSANPKQDSLKLLLDRVEQYGFDMCKAKDIHFKTNAYISNFNIPAENCYSLYLFAKEAINNAVKYSEGDLIELTLKQNEKLLEITISDNGKGFDTQIMSSGNGLRNMKDRAASLRGKLELKSSAGAGTGISLSIPIT